MEQVVQERCLQKKCWFAHLERVIAKEKRLKKARKVLVTAGPTIEAIDPVRYISNHPQGRWDMRSLRWRCFVERMFTLVTGKTAIEPPDVL